MTTAEFLVDLMRANLAIAAAVGLAIALRLPARRWLGARAAYGLWLLPLLAAAAVMLPARVVTLQAGAAPAPAIASEPAQAAAIVAEPAQASRIIPPSPVGEDPQDPWPLLLAGWLAGAAAFAGFLAWRQARFLRLAAQGLAGPAAVGVLRPRIVMPADSSSRFSPAEHEAVIAHETAHIAAQHPRVNGLIAVAQALCWFNPMVHLGAHLARLDQEFACDAAVVARRPEMRRLYAQTLLKTQLAATPLPLGCYWPARAEHPLTLRVEMLSRASGTRVGAIAGASLVAALAAGTGLAAWAAQPAQVRYALPEAAEPLTSRETDQAWLLMRSLEVDVSNQEHFLDRAPDPQRMRAFIASERAKIAQIKTLIAGKAVSETVKQRDGAALAARDAEWAEAARWDAPPPAGAVRATLFCAEGAACEAPQSAPEPYGTWAKEFATMLSRTFPAHAGEGQGFLVKVDMTPQTVALPISEKLVQSSDGHGSVDFFLGVGRKGLPLTVVPAPLDVPRTAGQRSPSKAPGAAGTKPAQSSTAPSGRITENDVLKARFQAAQAEVATAELVYEDTRRRYEVGLATQIELSQKRTDVAAARSRRAMAQYQVSHARVGELDSALKAGDWRRAAGMGATAAEIVRALQAKGGAAGLNPEETVVTITPDNRVTTTAMKPLPELDGATGARTAPLSGTGFAFSAGPGAIILYPASATALGPERK